MCPDKVTEHSGHHRASQGIGDEKGHVNFAARKRRLQKLGGKPHPQPLSKRRGEVVTIRVNNLLTCQLVNSSTCKTHKNKKESLRDFRPRGSPWWKEAATYSPALHCSTIGAGGLNFSVRNGKRWDTAAITTWNVSLIAVRTPCIPHEQGTEDNGTQP